MIKEVFSEKETQNFAMEIAKNVKKGDIYCLCGELGAGKTNFSKAFAKGLGIKEEITSPTFTIVNEYRENDISLFHFDVYRINDIEELYEIGYEEYFFSNGVCLIEWAEFIKEIIPQNAIWINIKKNIEKGENYRIIEVMKIEDTSH